MSRQELPVAVEQLLMTQLSSSSCSSDNVLTTCDTGCHTTQVTMTTSDTVDVSDVSVTVSVPVGSLSSAVDSNQTVSSLVSIDTV